MIGSVHDCGDGSIFCEGFSSLEGLGVLLVKVSVVFLIILMFLYVCYAESEVKDVFLSFLVSFLI